LNEANVAKASVRQTMLMMQPQYVISARLKLCTTDIYTNAHRYHHHHHVRLAQHKKKLKQARSAQPPTLSGMENK